MTVSSPLPLSNTEIQSLKARFEQAGQGHVFKFFKTLSQKEQASLLNQLLEIDVENLNTIYDKAIEGMNNCCDGGSSNHLKPLSKDVFDSVLKHEKSQIKKWEEIGLRQIAQGKVAVILMAGGQGTRLGSSDPKGCYNINLPSGKSLFQLQAERILRVQEMAHQYDPATSETIIPWFVMTSGPTNQHTFDFFEQNSFFGLKRENVIFFEQGSDFHCFRLKA
jgi:UDP-N-acetylglucosamine pyrophosphorylase